mmetsp:Transcript_14063/g.28725  ORF Transcript_14063/g.28725 Transcript_14063/m.28725 type:complete len:413 (+) Transcript_14063:143-1381(+)
MSSSDFLIVSIPNAPTADDALRKLRRATGPNQSYATLHPYTVPALLVGTLDALMTLSDSLSRTDQSLESTVKKIERAAADLHPNNASSPPSPLLVNGSGRDAYVSNFEWDYARFPHRRPLPELVGLIAKTVDDADDELRQLLQGLQEAQSSLTDLSRSVSGSFLTSDLRVSLSPDALASLDILDTEYLKTVFVAVPKAARKDFEDSAERLGPDIVSYAGPDGAGGPRQPGSPVVPGSVRFVASDYDSCLFTVVILRRQTSPGHVSGSGYVAGDVKDIVEEFGKACREKRFVLKSCVPDPAEYGRARVNLEEAKAGVEARRVALKRWCAAHFAECYASHLHLKVVRCFVESVLRHGLPYNCTTAAFRVKKSEALSSALRDATAAQGDAGNDGDEDEQDDEYLPYVAVKVSGAE